MSSYVALYCRISKDKSGRVEGVTAQEKWGRAYAAVHWTDVPVRVFADNNLSAADETVHRPQYEALCEAIRRGEVAHLWAVEQSRLQRREVGWFEFAAELARAGITELHTKRDGIVRAGHVVAGIKAVINADEVRTSTQRVNDRLAEIAADGRPAGSRVYGYEHGKDNKGGKTLHIVKAEADVVRECAERVLLGWSLARIATDLRNRGLHGAHRRKIRDANGEVVDTKPTTITANFVKGVVTNATVAGWRTHQGRQMRGVWEPILDQSTWDAVRNKLAAPRVVENSKGEPYPVSVTTYSSAARRRYLLTGGIAVCGVCDHPLIASMKQLKGRGGPVIPYYLCHPRTGGRACIGIMGDKFEEHVVNVLLDEIDKPDFRAALAADEYAARRDEITAALGALDGKRREYSTLAARPSSDDDALTAEEWFTFRRELKQQERDLRAELAALPPPASNVDVEGAREAWPEMNLDERRDFIGMFVARVIVDRAKPGTKGFDPTRVRAPEWRR